MDNKKHFFSDALRFSSDIKSEYEFRISFLKERKRLITDLSIEENRILDMTINHSADFLNKVKEVERVMNDYINSETISDIDQLEKCFDDFVSIMNPNITPFDRVLLKQLVFGA